MLHTAVLNILTGVTVAGIDAGKVFNTWPRMGSSLVPGDLWKKELGWRNFFENCSTV
jgi:cytochrome c oxidase assembly protein subunit 15